MIVFIVAYVIIVRLTFADYNSTIGTNYGEVDINMFDNVTQEYSRPTIYKCQCEGNEVLKDGQCIFHDTFLNILNSSINSQIRAETFSLFKVYARNIACEEDSSIQILLSNETVLTRNGVLYDNTNNQSYASIEYCLEHLLVEQETREVFKVCQDNARYISTTHCCPSGHILNQSLDCYPDPDFIISPPIFTNFSYKYIQGDVHKFNRCGHGFKFLVTNINAKNRREPHLTADDASGPYLRTLPKVFELAETYDKSQYCIGGFKKSTNTSDYSYIALHCKQEHFMLEDLRCKSKKCIHKCCPNEYIFSKDSLRCVKDYSNSTLEFWTKYIEGLAGKTAIVTGPPACEDYIPIRNPSHISSFSHLENGTLYIKSLSITYKLTQYCIEHVLDGELLHKTAFVCAGEETDYVGHCKWRYILFTVLMSISLVFVVITLIVYLRTKELRSKISGKCMISQLLSILMSQVNLIIIQNAHNLLSDKGCRIIGVMQHITTLSSFFWLNVLCFDVWLTIRSVRSEANSSHSKKRFLLYYLYGSGCPVLIGVLGVIMDNLPDDFENVIRTGIGKGSCFFAGRSAQWAYLYSVVSILLITNMALFYHIIFILKKAQRATERAFQGNNSRSTLNRENQRFQLYLKLFVVMGVTWIAEVISYEVEHHYKYSCLIWICLDAINASRGINIFLIFVCKRSILKQLQSKNSMPKLTLSRRISSVSFKDNPAKDKKSERVSGLSYNYLKPEVSSKTGNMQPLNTTEFIDKEEDFLEKQKNFSLSSILEEYKPMEMGRTEDMDPDCLYGKEF